MPQDDREESHSQASSSSEIFEVESILAERHDANKSVFLVKWVGFDLYESTWEDQASLRQSAAQAVADFQTICKLREKGKAPLFDVAEFEQKQIEYMESQEVEEEYYVVDITERRADDDEVEDADAAIAVSTLRPAQPLSNKSASQVSRRVPHKTLAVDEMRHADWEEDESLRTTANNRSKSPINIRKSPVQARTQANASSTSYPKKAAPLSKELSKIRSSLVAKSRSEAHVVHDLKARRQSDAAGSNSLAKRPAMADSSGRSSSPEARRKLPQPPKRGASGNSHRDAITMSESGPRSTSPMSKKQKRLVASRQSAVSGTPERSRSPESRRKQASPSSGKHGASLQVDNQIFEIESDDGDTEHDMSMQGKEVEMIYVDADDAGMGEAMSLEDSDDEACQAMLTGSRISTPTIQVPTNTCVSAKGTSAVPAAVTTSTSTRVSDQPCPIIQLQFTTSDSNDGTVVLGRFRIHGLSQDDFILSSLRPFYASDPGAVYDMTASTLVADTLISRTCTDTATAASLETLMVENSDVYETCLDRYGALIFEDPNFVALVASCRRAHHWYEFYDKERPPPDEKVLNGAAFQILFFRKMPLTIAIDHEAHAIPAMTSLGRAAHTERLQQVLGPGAEAVILQRASLRAGRLQVLGAVDSPQFYALTTFLQQTLGSDFAGPIPMDASKSDQWATECIDMEARMMYFIDCEMLLRRTGRYNMPETLQALGRRLHDLKENRQAVFFAFGDCPAAGLYPSSFTWSVFPRNSSMLAQALVDQDTTFYDRLLVLEDDACDLRIMASLLKLSKRTKQSTQLVISEEAYLDAGMPLTIGHLDEQTDDFYLDILADQDPTRWKTWEGLSFTVPHRPAAVILGRLIIDQWIRLGLVRVLTPENFAKIRTVSIDPFRPNMFQKINILEMPRILDVAAWVHLNEMDKSTFIFVLTFSAHAQDPHTPMGIKVHTVKDFVLQEMGATVL